MNDFIIRTCSRAELELILGWAAAEGWNPGKHDALPFQVADPAGFLLGLYHGRPIAAISAVRYSPSFGFIGLYLVVPEMRHQGFGLQLWRAGLDHLQSCTVGLDGVIAQQANYARSGFRLAYRQIRHGGPAPQSAQAPGLIDLRQVPLAQVLAYDQLTFPAERPGFLAAWISMPESQGLGVMANGRLRGFGVRRACLHGHKLGPLVADDEATAEELFLGLCTGVEGQQIFLDVPEINPSARHLAQRHGLQPVFETARMYKDGEAAINTAQIFGVTSFELG